MAPEFKGKQAAIPSTLQDSSSSSSDDSDSDSDLPPRRRTTPPPPPLLRARSLAAEVILQHEPIRSTLSSPDSVFLDFACGSGALSREIVQHVDHILGIDVDPAAVSAYNQRAQNQGLDESEMHAVVCDVLTLSDETGDDDVSCKEWFSAIDVAACAMGFHHLQDMTAVTKAIASKFLKPKGWFCVVDLLWTEHTAAVFTNLKTAKQQAHTHSHTHSHTHHDQRDSSHSHSHTHSHNHNHTVHVGGLHPADLRQSLVSAGLTDVEVFEHAFEVPVMVPESLLPEQEATAGSSASNADGEDKNTRKVEVLLPFLFAVGRKS
ncbi:S-adenosyl-L-methionine-dependent methyltransferase [Myxozyma melibiosi]|uniref:S-adenosyl-L-methionine-dependent methyltransferase n=1 Tax=Myxozyma melibiosi TaxID=54550 RepID=A0ABR1EYC6_9ASCO